MKKTRCPACGNIQAKAEIPETPQAQILLDFIKQQGREISYQVDCTQCKTVFSQDKYEISDDIIMQTTQKFVDKYYNYDAETEEERTIVKKEDWVGCDIGDIFEIGDCFFDFELMQKALELNATEEEVFDYYYKSLESYPEIKDFEDYIKEKRDQVG